MKRGNSADFICYEKKPSSENGNVDQSPSTVQKQDPSNPRIKVPCSRKYALDNGIQPARESEMDEPNGVSWRF